MRLIEMICEELGVEVGEEWAGNDGNHYILAKEGYLYIFNIYEDRYIPAPIIKYTELLRGELKPTWKPKQGEKYYVPSISATNKDYMWNDELWGIDKIYDETMLKRNLVFKNKEDAINTACRMLDAIQRRE